MYIQVPESDNGRGVKASQLQLSEGKMQLLFNPHWQVCLLESKLPAQ